MKLIIIIALFITFIAQSFAGGPVTKKLPKEKFVAQRYNKVICNQKYIPMKIEQSLSAHSLTVKFTAQRSIDQFKILNVRGIEGVKVTKFQEQNVTDLSRGETLSSLVELSDFSGLVYVVFDVEIILNGVKTGHSIPIAVGTLTEAQKRERSKNIKVVIPEDQSKEGTSPLNTPVKRYHENQVE